MTAINSSRSRYVRQYRRYHRTHRNDDLILEMTPSETRSRGCHQAHGIRDGPAAFATDLCGGPLLHARWPTPPGVESVPV